MGQTREKLHIYENVMARVGLGGDFLGEYFKALSTLNGLQVYNDLNPPQPPGAQNIPPQGANQPVSAPMTPETGQSTTLGGNGLGGAQMA